MTTNGPTSVRSDRVGAVRRLANRSFRHKVGRFLVEGPQGVSEAVRHRPDIVDEVFVVDEAVPAAAAVAAEARRAGRPVTAVPEPVLLAMTETVHPQGIAAVCRFLDTTLDRLPPESRLVAVLHQVRDPGNAGTVIRTAAAAGADAVVLSGDSVDPYNGKVVRSTAGSLFQLPVLVDPDLAAVVARLRGSGVRVVATSGYAERALPDAPDLAAPTAWVFGNEAHGLPADTPCDELVRVPLFGPAESLNLAVTAGVCLYASAFARAS